MPEHRSPLQEDTAAHQVARALGFELVRRYRAIDVTDPKALKEAGWTITLSKPDFARISAALEAGEPVQGAKWRGIEYVLRPVSR